MKDKEVLKIMQALPEEYLDEAMHYQLLAATLTGAAGAASGAKAGAKHGLKSFLKAHAAMKIAVPAAATAAAASVAVVIGVQNMDRPGPTIPNDSIPVEVTEISTALTESTDLNAVIIETVSEASETSKTTKTTAQTTVSEEIVTAAGTEKSSVSAAVTTNSQTSASSSAKTSKTTATTASTSKTTSKSAESSVSTAPPPPGETTETTTTTTTTGRTEPQEYMLGDVNMDGIINNEDVTLLLNEYLTVVVNGEESRLTEEQIRLGDVIENNPYYPFGKYPVERSLRGKPIIETDYPITQTDAWVVLAYVQEQRLGKLDAQGTLEEYIEATDPATWRGSYRYQFVYVPDDFCYQDFPVDSFGTMPMSWEADGMPLTLVGYEVCFYGVKNIECCYYGVDGSTEFEGWVIHQPDIVLPDFVAERWCTDNPDVWDLGDVQIPYSENEREISDMRDFTLLIANRRVTVRIPENCSETAANDFVRSVYDLYTTMYTN